MNRGIQLSPTTVSRMYVLQKGMDIDKSSPDAKRFLLYMMDLLEKMKEALASEEALKAETVGQAHVENYALKLFAHADTEDRAGIHNKNVVKAFYNSSLLFEVLSVFGPLSEDIEKYKKYARYKSAYINRCMKAGMTPVPGPVDEEGQDLGMGNLSVSDYMASRDQSGATSTDYNPAGYGGSSAGASGYQPPGDSGYQQPGNPGFQDPSAGSGGYQQPQPQATYVPPKSSGDFEVDWEKATKFAKYATSSLTYEDKEAAIDYLTKALNILTTGHE